MKQTQILNKLLTNLKQNKTNYFLALFFFLMQIILIVVNQRTQNYSIFYWFCNHAPIIFAFAFLFNKPNITKALINVGFIAQFLWTIDFLSKILFNTYIFQVTDYVFETMSGFSVAIPILIHIFSTNIAFYFTYQYRPTKKTLIYSFIYITILYMINVLYAPPIFNTNCIQYICGLKELTFDGYKQLWIFLTFIIVIIPTQLIQHLAYKLNKKIT